MPTKGNNPNPSLLKDAREEKGLTLEIVHEATKVPLDALKAIEEGYSVRQMSPFYYRGFIKIYAEFLGLDVAEVLRQYGIEANPGRLQESAAEVKAKAKAKAKKAQQKPNYAFEQFQEWLALVWTKKNLKKFGKFLGVLLALFLLARVAGCMIAGIQSAFKAKPRMPKVVEKEKKGERKKESSKAVVPAPKKEEIPVAVAKAEKVNGKVSLVVRASRDTWMQVKADGRTVFEMTMKKGTMEAWSAEKEIILTGKNINELDMEINGDHLGTLGRADRRAKKVVITKEGLSVKK